MKYSILVFLLLPLLIYSQGSKKRSALFIGNSYTFVNSLPNLVEQLALASGDTLIVDSYAPGGYTFSNHFYDLNCKTKIYSKDWDFVILQAQSQEPSFSPGQVNAQTLPYALKLDSLIKDNNPCTQTVFYETWGRKFGDASNCPSYPPVCTYTGMQNRLKESYKQFADLCHGLMAPVGEAYRASITQSPSLELYQADQSHPSLEGSYLAASVFYEVLFQKSVISNTYISSVNSSTAGFLQQIAHSVVRDSLPVWNLGIHYPWADFTYTVNSPNVYQFQSYSGNLSNTLYFGDGSFSSGTSFTHTYAVPGSYSVSQSVNDNCHKDSVSHVILVSTAVNISEYQRFSTVESYPNPVSDFLYFTSKEPLNVQIFSPEGTLILHEKANERISLENLESGIYLLYLESAGLTKHSLLVKSKP